MKRLDDRTRNLESLGDGKVGIGDTTPAAKLEVTSVMRLTPTDTPGSCSAALEGGIYYDALWNEPCFCNGTDWERFGGNGNC